MKGGFTSAHKWADSSIDKRIVDVLKKQKITNLSNIQHEMIQNRGKHIIGLSNTGSGKTVAFLVTTLQMFLDGKKKGAILIANTNRLVQQLVRETKKYSDPVGVDVIEISKNVPFKKDSLLSDNPKFLICTERIVDMLDKDKDFSTFFQKNIDVFIIDEADHMLTQTPTRNNIMFIAGKMLKTKRTFILTSATFSEDACKYAKELLEGPHVLIDTRVKQDTSKIVQKYIQVPSGDVFPTVAAQIIQHSEVFKEKAKVLVFFNSGMMVEAFSVLMYEILNNKEISSNFIHGKLETYRQKRSSEFFKDCANCVLFTSDLTARGIDIAQISLVIQVGSTDETIYEQRCGRTGRAGNNGICLTVLSENETIPVGTTELKKTDEKSLGLKLKPTPTLKKAITTKASEKQLNGKLTRGYISLVGYYSSKRSVLKMDKKSIIPMVDDMFKGIGVTNIVINDSLLKKMGMS